MTRVIRGGRGTDRRLTEDDGKGTRSDEPVVGRPQIKGDQLFIIPDVGDSIIQARPNQKVKIWSGSTGFIIYSGRYIPERIDMDSITTSGDKMRMELYPLKKRVIVDKSEGPTPQESKRKWMSKRALRKAQKSAK